MLSKKRKMNGASQGTINRITNDDKIRTHRLKFILCLKIFLVSSVFVLFIIVAITSGIKVWQAIRTNPIKLLRTE